MDDSDYDPEVEEVQDGIDRPTSENNPIRMAERGSISPSFLNTTGKDSERQNNRGLAQKDLKASEQNASKNSKEGQEKDKNKGSLGKAMSLEKKPGSPANSIVNKVTGKGKQDGEKGTAKGFMKKRGAAILLTLLIGGGAVGAGVAGQGLQGFSLVNNIIQNSNLAGSALKARVVTATYSMLNRKTVPTPETKKVFKQTGIDLNTDEKGLIKSISYEDNSGKIKTITNAEELGDAFSTDPTFDSKVTKTADILDIEANYGKVRQATADRISLSRSRFGEYDAEGADHTKGAGFLDLAAEPDIKMQNGGYVNKETGEPADADSDDSEVRYGDETTVKGSDYDDTLDQIVKIDESDTVSNTTMSSETLKIDEDFESKVNDAKGKISGLSTAACAYSTIAQGVAAITIAKQIVDMINLASGFMEGTQRCQAGDGTCSSMKKYLEIFSTGDFWQAISLQSLFGAPGASSQSAGVANLENIFNNKGIAMSLERHGISRTAWQSCTYSKLIANSVGFISDVIGIFTGGLFSLFKKVIKTVVISAVITMAIGTAIKGIIKLASKALHFDVIQDMGSKYAGDYVVGGGGLSFDYIGKADGLVAGTQIAVSNFHDYHNSVVASRALYDRENLSPFDISSPYTFLGSLVESMVSFSVLNSAKGAPLTKMLSTTSSMLTNSIVGLLPQAAATTYNNIANEVGDCPIAETVGAVSNANHCRNFVVADTSTFGITYEESVRYLTKAGQLDEDGKIVKESDLAEYVTNWTQRDSLVGLADNEIQQRYHKYETGNAAIDGAVGGFPLVGDYIDMVNAKRDIQYQGEIFGSEYVIGSDEWDERKQYEHTFVGLDTAYNTLGLIQDSAVAQFLDEYYKENPIDHSYEGTLARFSGLPKSEVSSILAYMDYMEEVARYDPEERLSFAEKLEKPILLDADEKSGNDLMLPLEGIAYFDLRSKSYAV